MASRSLARILAPLALLTAIVGIVLVVQISRTNSSARDRTSARTTTTHPARRTKPRPHFYVVKPGDNLTSIASRTGVTIERLQQLNPDVDPQALHAGARLRIAR